MVVVHHALLGLSVAALAGAGSRVAALAAPRGLERAVAAAAVAASAAVLEALGLGLVSVGTSPVALAAAALVTWIAAWRLVDPPRTTLAGELAEWWRDCEPWTRIALGAAAGAWLAWTVWLLRYPALGFDSVAYHLPEIVGWIHSGRPGAVEAVFPGLPVGNYPLTNEVLVAWQMGIARSFAPAALSAPAWMLLLAGASWLGLRTLEIPRTAAVLAVASICLTPVLTHYQMNGVYTDLPALAWLVSAAALCAAAGRRPALLVPALLAAGLAVGTKTTTAPLAALVIVVGCVRARGDLRRLARPLILAAAIVVCVGGYWYLRNLVDHGSPLWPFASLPGGDPVPPAIGDAARFVEDPRTTLDRIGDEYLRLFAGGIVMLAGALLAPLVARRREVLAGAGAVAFSLLLWANAPVTGAAIHDPATFSATRYLLPGLAAATLTLALAVRAGGVASVYGLLALAGALGVNAVQTLRLGFPSVPSGWTPLAGAAVGAAAAALLARVGRRPRLHPAATVAAAVAVGALLAPAASGLVDRHTDARLFDADLLRWFDSNSRARDPDTGADMSQLMVGLLAGDRVERRVDLLPPREPCRQVLDAARRRWVIVVTRPFAEFGPSSARRCLAAAKPLHRDGFRVYGGGRNGQDPLLGSPQR